MPDLSFIDLITPYILRGAGFGPWHPALTALSVDAHETAISTEGVNIRGTVHFQTDIRPYFDPSRMVMGVEAEHEENHPLNDTTRRDPWFDLRDVSLQFELTVPRTPSQKVLQAANQLVADPNFGPANLVLAQYQGAPLPSDYPRTEFVLDFIIVAELHAPFLRGALLADDGQLVPDPNNERVTFTVPKVKIRLSQGSGINDPLNINLLSAGASGLDDPGDTAVSEMVTMKPPYAFFGTANVAGFGFRSAVLDLSNASTPPDILAQFGYDDTWTGLYLPEIRLFIAPHGARDLAVDAGVRNLLIGLGQSHGVTGDFEFEVLNQGAGDLKLGARFYDLAQRGYGITYTDDDKATVQLPELTRMVIDVEGGRVPIVRSASVDGVSSDKSEIDIDLSSVTQRTIELNATDSSKPVRKATPLTITASRQGRPTSAPAGTQQQAKSAPVDVTTTSIKQGAATVGGPHLRRVNETPPPSVTVGLDAPGTPAWKVNGDDKGSSVTVTFDVQPGVEYTIQATLPAKTVQDLTAYFRYDHPLANAGSDYSTNPANSRTEAAPDQTPTTTWTAGSDSMSALRGTLQALPDHSKITITGYASYEGPDPPQLQKYLYNQALAQRRADALKSMIDRLTSTQKPPDPIAPELAGRTYDFSFGPVADMSTWQQQGGDVATRRQWWKAVASFGPTNSLPTVIQGKAFRKAVQPPANPPQIKVLDPVPDKPQTPDWFHLLGGKLRIVRNQFVACEVFGKFDIQTAAEKRAAAGQLSPPQQPMLPTATGLGDKANMADGLIDARVVVQFDDATDTVTVTGYLGADPADRDGLALFGTRPGATPDPNNPSYGLNFLGESALFLPLISEVTGTFANQGALVEMPIAAAGFGVIAGLAATKWVRTERVIWYGGELKVVATPRRAPPAVPIGEWSTTLLCDIETAISADFLGLVKIRRDAPLAVRYKAIGLMFGAPPGQPRFQFRPMFDSSRGYTIDVARPGGIEVAGPLEKVLKILGARIARNNPMLFEIDLGFAIDLGVVSIDRARLRARVDPPPLDVELTAFGAGVNIPGALRGRGYMELNSNEIKGSLDLTLVPVKVRVAAGLGIKQIGPVTGVIVDLDVEFPVAIPLGSSGLGIYGFLGLFAMHYARDESIVDAGNQAPALAWLVKTDGNAADLKYWTGMQDHWAFGIGALLGTMGSSVVFNLKGLVLLELPGPRLLLMMKANLLMPMPPRTGPLGGVFFAVIDLDMGRGTLTIGISAEFKVKPVLRVEIPVEAFFNFNNVPDWHLYLGRYDKQIHADILEVFQGTGYLMLSGDGIPAHASLPAVTGFSIGVGLHVSFVWGSKSAGLYAELAAGLDAAVGFDPFRFAGILYVRGELHLFIIGISAWANLQVDMGEDPQGNDISRIAGEICGEIELLFFTIKGCVDFEIGADAVPLPDPPPLAKSLKLTSRSPALVIGTGVDRPIDSGIGDGVESAAQPADDNMPVVPIDAIPVLMLSAPPVHDGVKFKGTDLQGSPDTPSGGWVARGDTWFSYTLKSVDLSGSVSAGSTPATWWAPKSGDKAFAAQLALLSWIPEATPKAIEYSKHLEDWVKEYWGTICLPIAPSTSFMLTFMQEVLGPSPAGWWLDGVAWPDPPGTIRSELPDVEVRVTERWRCGDRKLDQLRGVVPAEVQSAPVYCPPARPSAPSALTAEQPGPDVIGAARGRKMLDSAQMRHLLLTEAAHALNSGGAVPRAALAATGGPIAPSAAAPPGCESRVLASPLYEDHWRLINPPANEREQFIRNTLALTKYTPGPLVDAVSFHTGAVRRATFYLFVPGRVLEGSLLVIDVMSPSEGILRSRVVTTADAVPGVPFPARWDDPNGPWYSDVYKLKQHQTFLAQWGYTGVLVTIDGATGADRIQVGLRVQDPKLLATLTARAFYVAAIELERTSEFVRFDFDNKQQGHKQSIAGTVLSSAAADYALLQPGTAYSVTLNWDASRERRPQGKSPQDHKDVPNNSQTFWFRTDANPPPRLDPWMLASTPDEGEKHFFTEAGMKLVFATTNVVRLFETYGKQLQVRIRSASLRPTPSTPAVPHPLVLDANNVIPVAKSVLDPFEDALEHALDGTCVPVAGSRNRHSQVDIPIPLEPFTDYVLDVEMVDAGAQDGEGIWRRSFSTGAFATLQEFAHSFFTARVKHRSVAPGALQEIGAKFATQAPEGGDFDAEIVKAGIEPLEVPDQPRLIVFWQQDGQLPPQPVAVIIDGSEPLWRSRLLPREINDPTPDGNKRFELKPIGWLEPTEGQGGDKIVDNIIAVPGAQRAFVTLKPSSRGTHLCLALRRIAQPEPYLDGPAATDQLEPIADLILDRAPWEELD